MISVIIPSSGGACFGMYRPAPGPAVLMCPPFGDEALKTARIWRDLALEWGEHGVATLRFDLPGTGNSAGDPTEPGRVEAWQAAVRSCTAWLADRHGDRIILLGHRFGALLALDAAASIAAEGLVLFDPPASGASLARYLRARARMGANGALPEGPDYIQVGGLPVSAATLAALSAVPAPLARPSYPPALLVLKDHAASPNPWPDRLHASGSRVETTFFDGYDDFVLRDPFQAKAPTAVFERVTQFVAQLAPSGASPTSEMLPAAAELTLEGATEVPVWFGPENGMFGILCRPDQPAPGVPALLLPTTGIDPCSGMARMWTELARRVARQGITSFRFDMAGAGESETRLRSDRLSAAYHPDRMLDLRRAVDVLATHGFDQVTAVAYCSGAYAAWHAAREDQRIAGILTANLVYWTLQKTLAADVLSDRPGSSRLGREPGPLVKLLPARGLDALRRFDDRARRAVPRPIRHLLRTWEADQQETRRHVNALTARGCTVTMVMSQDDHGHLRLRRAYGEALRLPKGVELFVIPDADHHFSDRRHRARFLDLATAFASRQPPPKAPAQPIHHRVLEPAT